MRVLHIIPAFQPAVIYGGPVVSVSSLCSALHRIGVEIKVLTTNAAGWASTSPVDVECESAWRELPVRYCKRDLPEMVSISLLREVTRYTKWCDVVHLTGVYNFTTFPAILAARCIGRPLVWSPRGALQRWEGSRRERLKGLWNSVAEIATDPSVIMHVTGDSEATESALRFRAPRWRIVANGIEIPEKILPKEPGRNLRLGFLGRLDPKKGLENLIQGLRHLKNSNSGAVSVTLSIAGQGESSYELRLKRLVSQLGLEESVSFEGFLGVSEKAVFFSRVDVAVFPSHTENFGLVVGEALSYGVPVVVSPNMPWRDVEGKGCGLCVDNSPESLADALLRMRDMDLPSMGETGRQWMESEYSWTGRAQEMAAVYREALSRADG